MKSGLDFSALNALAYRGCSTPEDRERHDHIIAQGARIIEGEPLPFDAQADQAADAPGPSSTPAPAQVEVKQIIFPADIPLFCDLYRAGKVDLLSPLVYDKTGTRTLYAHFLYRPQGTAVSTISTAGTMAATPPAEP